MHSYSVLCVILSFLEYHYRLKMDMQIQLQRCYQISVMVQILKLIPFFPPTAMHFRYYFTMMILRCAAEIGPGIAIHKIIIYFNIDDA